MRGIQLHYNIFPKGFQYREVKKHMIKSFSLEEAVLALQRFFLCHFIKREIGWYDVMYNFKLKASQLKRKFVDILDIWHLFT